MSEPSPEAKQAAAIWKIPEQSEFNKLQAGPVIVLALREAFAFGYDTATADVPPQGRDVEKVAREAVIQLQNGCIQLDPRIAITVMRYALAQVSAPLVEALATIREQWHSSGIAVEVSA